MAIQDVITHVQSVIPTAITSIKYAPAYPTDKRIATPTCISFATNIRIDIEGGWTLKFFDLRIEILIPRKDLSDAMQVLVPIPEQVAGIFTADPTIGGTCQTYGGSITANLITDTVDGIQMIGYAIVVPNVKI